MAGALRRHLGRRAATTRARFALVALRRRRAACTRAQIADELGMRRCVVPRYPGIAAALGLLRADVRHDLRRSFVLPAAAELDAGAGRGARVARREEVEPLLQAPPGRQLRDGPSTCATAARPTS